MEGFDLNCPKCNSEKTIRHGSRRLLNTWRQTYQCKECGKRFTPQPEEKLEHIERVGPKILFLDVETAPMLGFFWQLKTDYISPDNIVTPTFILCWSAKWFGDEHVMGDVVTSREAIHQDDKRICKGIYTILCEADLVVAFNGDWFDFKKLNYRFIVNGFTPPSEYRTIDPIVSLRSQFGFDSNRLDYTNLLFGIERKTETNFKLWKDCYFGDVDALDTMLQYNKNDVEILEANYLRIRPWMRRHPNLGVYYEHEGEICRICGGTQLREVLDKYHYTNVGKYSLYRCQECGAESVGRHSELSKEKRDSLVK